jgi:hypothetical protein
MPVKASAPDLPLQQMSHPILSGRNPMQVFEGRRHHDDAGLSQKRTCTCQSLTEIAGRSGDYDGMSYMTKL